MRYKELLKFVIKPSFQTKISNLVYSIYLKKFKIKFLTIKAKNELVVESYSLQDSTSD